MKFLKKPIFTGFMPNLLFKDVAIAMSFLLPWNWKKIKKGNSTTELERKLEKLFDVESAVVFDSGRTSLQLALEILGVQKDDEVLVQAYTCCVVSNAIQWTGAKPVYIDITNQFNMDPEDLEKKITPRAKVLIIQHTFGIPAELHKLIETARHHNLKVIEDCAHIMGAKYQGKMLGTYADIGMLSFGADKPISSGRGGALITKDKRLAQALQKAQRRLPHTTRGKIFQQLITFKLFFVSKPLYNIWVGKIFLGIFKKIRILSRIIEPNEKRGEQLPYYPAQLPNALARIALHQLEHLQEFNKHREHATQKYISGIQNPQIYYPRNIEGLPLLRFPLLVQNPHMLHKQAHKEGILLGDWYNTVIAPKDTNISKMGYIAGSCPNAERLSKESINLPTSIHIRTKDQERIIALVNHYAE